MRVAGLPSPLGVLRVSSNGEVLTGMYYPRRGPDPAAIPAGEGTGGAVPDPVLVRAARQLERYFAGELRGFDLPLAPSGTPFQRAVWDALLEVPFGETIGYGELARRVGRPTAARAVANAVGSNPISIVVPCHRVIGADGSLTGYGGGLERKRRLLELEGSLEGRLDLA